VASVKVLQAFVLQYTQEGIPDMIELELDLPANRPEFSLHPRFSFTADAEGKAQAESAFLDLLRENKVEADETPDQVYVDQGEHDDGAGYLIYLVNSTA
jgi:hypothetical protein